MNDAKHVALKNLPNGSYEMECKHCKRTYIPALPCPMDMFLAMSNSFIDAHEACLPTEVKGNEQIIQKEPV